MKLLKNQPLVGSVALAALLAATVVLAQSAGKAAIGYDPSKEITVQGTITSVKTIDCPKGTKGILLELAGLDKSYIVHVGPQSWLDRIEFEFQQNDRIEITGAMGPCGGQVVLKPREITRGQVTVTLRDKAGDPLWDRPWAG